MLLFSYGFCELFYVQPRDVSNLVIGKGGLEDEIDTIEERRDRAKQWIKDNRDDNDNDNKNDGGDKKDKSTEYKEINSNIVRRRSKRLQNREISDHNNSDANSISDTATNSLKNDSESDSGDSDDDSDNTDDTNMENNNDVIKNRVLKMEDTLKLCDKYSLDNINNTNNNDESKKIHKKHDLELPTLGQKKQNSQSTNYTLGSMLSMGGNINYEHLNKTIGNNINDVLLPPIPTFPLITSPPTNVMTKDMAMDNTANCFDIKKGSLSLKSSIDFNPKENNGLLPNLPILDDLHMATNSIDVLSMNTSSSQEMVAESTFKKQNTNVEQGSHSTEKTAANGIEEKECNQLKNGARKDNDINISTSYNDKVIINPSESHHLTVEKDFVSCVRYSIDVISQNKCYDGVLCFTFVTKADIVQKNGKFPNRYAIYLLMILLGSIVYF